METVDELLDVLVHQRVDGDVVNPLALLGARGQLTVDEQVRGLEIGAVLGELLDRVAAVEEDAAIAVDIRDAARAGRGVHERRVVEQEPVVVRGEVHLLERRRADGPPLDRDLVGGAGTVVGDGEGLRHGRVSLPRFVALLSPHQDGGRDEHRTGSYRLTRV